MVDCAASEADLAAIGVLKACNRSQKCGFAAARWAEQTNDVARRNVQAHITKGGSAVVRFANVLNFEE